jgi:hypothetical protein
MKQTGKSASGIPPTMPRPRQSNRVEGTEGRTMGSRITDDLQRAMQRIALMERRLERLESLVRTQALPDAESRPETPSGKTVRRLLDRPAGDLRFPELRLQLVETPPPPPEQHRVPSVSNARAAVESCPHLLQPLSTLWGHPEFDRYVSRLVVDDRGGRKGFSAEVMEELLFLAQLNHQFCPTWHPRDPWEDPQFMGDRS